jgi:hypothetical protein
MIELVDPNDIPEPLGEIARLSTVATTMRALCPVMSGNFP